MAVAGKGRSGARRMRRRAPKGVKPVRARLADGSTRIYYYHRASGRRLEHDPWSADGLLEIQGLDAEAASTETMVRSVVSTQTRSFAALWRLYRQSKFPLLALRTRKDYDAVRDWLGDAMERVPVAGIRDSSIEVLRDKAILERGRRFGNYVVQVMRIVLAFGVKRKWLKANPAKGLEMVPKPKTERAVNRSWTMAEIRAVLAADCPPHIALPVLVSLYGSLREADVLKVTIAAVKGGKLRFVAGKNSEAQEIPLGGKLAELVEARLATKWPSVQLCLNSRGQPWSESGFRASFFKRIRKLHAAGLVDEGLTFHGLRHTIGTLSRELGFSDFETAAAIGDRSTAMAEVYGRNARRRKAQITVLTAVQGHFENALMENEMENASSGAVSDDQ